MTDVYPVRSDGLCACGCEQKLEGRRTRWANEACSIKASTLYFILKGDVPTIRKALYARDHGVCGRCHTHHPKWEAHHTIAVIEGGGRCDLSGYETLCPTCHNIETQALRARRAEAIARGEIIVIKHEWITQQDDQGWIERRRCTRCHARQSRLIKPMYNGKRWAWSPKAKPCA
jgi:hypothetical protein